MRTALLTQRPTTPKEHTIQAFLKEKINKEQFDCAKVAVAYATVSGVRALLATFKAHGLTRSFWLLGLDDAITQPGAIDLLLSLDSAEVRVASHEDTNFRFHPKFFAFAHTRKSKKLLSLVGSANLTASALCGNAEAVAVLESQNENDRNSVEEAWCGLWDQGHNPNKKELEEYKNRYNKSADAHKKIIKIKQKKKFVKRSKEVLASDSAEIDPSMANICWIECGYITAMGRELEFKAEQGLFFGLNPSGGEPKKISIRTSGGTPLELTMKYQGNHMWRLQMNNDVPEVKVGLRPKMKNGKLGRSPYVAVFTRNPAEGAIDLKFIDLKGKKFADLKAQTLKSGTLGKTPAREYGWCS